MHADSLARVSKLQKGCCGSESIMGLVLAWVSRVMGLFFLSLSFFIFPSFSNISIVYGKSWVPADLGMVSIRTLTLMPYLGPILISSRGVDNRIR